MTYKLQNHGKGPQPNTGTATFVGPNSVVISIAGFPVDTSDALESVIEQRMVDGAKAAFAEAARTATP